MRSWADALTETARSGSRMIWLRYRAYASPGTPVDVLLPEGRRVKAVLLDTRSWAWSLSRDGRLSSVAADAIEGA